MRKTLIVMVLFTLFVGTVSANPLYAYIKDASGNDFTNPFYIDRSETIDLSLQLADIRDGDLNVAYDLQMQVFEADGVTPASPSEITYNLVKTSVTPTADPYTELKVATITAASDIPVGNQYVVRITAGGNTVGSTTLESAHATKTTEAIPEFPTVALPVAAILGLAFLFQRRKEE